VADDALRWDDRPTLRRPILLAAFEGWADGGEAASSAIRYFESSWGARPFAAIDPEEFYDFTETRPRVRLDERGRRRIDWPENIFSAASAPGSVHDVVLLRGVEPQLKWRRFTSLVLDVVDALGIEMVISLGALLADIPHTRPVRITGTSASDELVVRMNLRRSRYQGPTGIMSVLHDRLGTAEVPAASYWAAVPHYVSGTPSPKATLALVRQVSALLDARVEVVDLEIAAAAYVRQVNEVVSGDDDVAAYVRRLELAAADDEDLVADDDHDVPDGETLAAEVERFLRDQNRD
jgi:hypothetical protein